LVLLSIVKPTLGLILNILEKIKQGIIVNNITLPLDKILKKSIIKYQLGFIPNYSKRGRVKEHYR